MMMISTNTTRRFPLRILAVVALLFVGLTTAFQTASQPGRSAATPATTTTTTTTTALNMASEQDFMRWARASRSAQADDNVVELLRPLGLVLNEDDKGNVYVETVAPRGNAARTGKVRERELAS